MQKLFLGSLAKGPHISTKTFHAEHERCTAVCKFEESKEWSAEERQCELLRHEYKMCKDANPDMGSTYLGSQIVIENGQKVLKHPTKKEYLTLLVEKAKQIG